MKIKEVLAANFNMCTDGKNFALKLPERAHLLRESIKYMCSKCFIEVIRSYLSVKSKSYILRFISWQKMNKRYSQ